MEIPREFADAMVQHAIEEDPNECCGLLAGKDGQVLKHYRMTNTESKPLPLQHGRQGSPSCSFLLPAR